MERETSARAAQPDLLALVERIYAAALEPRCWPECLAALCEALSADFAIVSVLDLAAHRARVIAHHNVSDAVRTGYTIALEDSVRATSPSRGGRPVGRSVQVDVADLEGYWREQTAHAIGRLAGRADESPIHVAVARHREQGRYLRREALAIERLMPHFHRAAQPSCRGVEDRLLRQVGAQVLDRLRDAVLLVDPRARVLARNRAAEELVGRRGVLAIRDGVLRATDAVENEALVRAIAAASSSTARPDAPVATLALHGSDDAVLHHAAVFREDRTRAEQRAGALGTALVVVSGPQGGDDIPAGLLRAHWGLTAAEATVVAALGVGGSLDELASRLNVRLDTVRSHLRNAMTKADVHSQTQLLRRAMRAVPALRLD